MEHCSFDLYYFSLFQTCFIVVVTVSSIVKHPNMSFFNVINILSLLPHFLLYILLKSIFFILTSIFLNSIQRMHDIVGLRCTIVLLLGQLSDFVRDTSPAAFTPAITFIVQSLSYSREHPIYPMRVGQDHCAVVAFDKICSSSASYMASLQNDSAMFKELATNVWGTQMLSGVGTKQDALSDRDRGWFLGGLAKLAGAMPAQQGVLGMRMLLGKYSKRTLFRKM